MKTSSAALLSTLAGAAHGKVQSAVNPLGSVISLLDELTAKITKDGEAEAKAYTEYVEWCDDFSKNGAFAIETATKQKDQLVASITELGGKIEAAGSKIEGLASDIAAAEADLKAATQVRAKESEDFTASEKELVLAISQLTRAVNILEREMSKNPAAFAQMSGAGGKSMAGIIHAFSAVLDAAAFTTSDQKQLAALVQSQQGEDDDDELGSPAAATYKSKSGSILDVLEDLKEKAEGQLSDLRKAQTNTKHNFEMLKQSLEDQNSNDNKDMAETKSAKASAQEGKAAAQGDLARTEKELANSKQQRATAQSTCMQVAADHQATVASRKEELQVIAQAQQVLRDTTSGAEGQTYSFYQVNVITSSGTSVRLQTVADLAGREVIELVKKLAKKEHSAALAQLASRISAVARFSTGQDVFAKVKGLIQDMIAKLEREAGSEATEKAYCDEQLAKTEAKKGDLGFDIAKMTSKIDKAAARSAQLKGQVKELQAQLAELTRAQAKMDKVRSETRADYATAKADLEMGLSGVRKALGALQEYYGGAAMVQDDASPGAFMQRMQQPEAPVSHAKAGGAGGSIISILEVVESDFAKNLAKEESEEADAQTEYEKVSQENAITKTLKDQDVKYKTQEAKAADVTVSEYSSDRETANTELSAVLDFYGKLKERCIAKPEAYGERQQRREAEIAGLKEALSVLEDETALVQRKRRGSFRGSSLAVM